MLKYFCILILFTGTDFCFGQDYFIAFKDKNQADTNLIHSLLAQKSIDRRAAQNISFDATDIPIKAAYLDSLDNLGITPIYISKWLNGILFTTTDLSLLETLKTKNYIKYVHDLNKTSVGGEQAYTNTDYGSNSTAADFFNIPCFHNKENLGQGKLIAVFDGGFKGVNTAISFQYTEIKDLFNFKDKNDLVYDFSSHGTNVFSLLAANEKGKFIGFAPNADYALYVTENTSSETILEQYNWLFAAERADSLGVDIINSSLGYYDFDFPSTNHTFDQLDGATSVISRAANIAAQKGILVISSSGNSNTSSTWPYINFPSDAPLVLSVGAIGYDKKIASYSSHGPINNTYFKPEIVAPGTSISVLSSSGNVTTTTGTSVSAPMITGLATLIWVEHPEFTAQELKHYLIENSSNYATPNNEIGYGYPLSNKIVQTEKIHTSKIISTHYYDLNGKRLDNRPRVRGFYIQLNTYENEYIETLKIIVE